MGDGKVVGEDVLAYLKRVGSIRTRSQLERSGAAPGDTVREMLLRRGIGRHTVREAVELLQGSERDDFVVIGNALRAEWASVTGPRPKPVRASPDEKARRRALCAAAEDMARVLLGILKPGRWVDEDVEEVKAQALAALRKAGIRPDGEEGGR